MMDAPFTLPLPEGEKVVGAFAKPEISDEKRDFTRKINKALIALQDAQRKFRVWHPDTSNKEVAEHNLEILSEIAEPIIEVISDLAMQSYGYGYDFQMDEIDGHIRELPDLIRFWKDRVRETE